MAEAAPEDPTAARMKVLAKMYTMGLKYLDMQASQNALYEMIILQPGNINLKDSLAYFYFNGNKYGSAIAVATEVLSANPGNLGMLELRALCSESIQFYNEALLDYEKLYLANTDPFTLYKVAFLQFNLQRLAECKTNVDILLNDAKTENLKISIAKSEVEEQEIPLRASLHNLKGLLLKGEGKKDEARKSFEKALGLAPDFAVAQNNLAQLAANK